MCPALINAAGQADRGRPAVPLPGPVDVSLGLLIARTAGPLRRDVLAALHTYF